MYCKYCKVLKMPCDLYGRNATIFNHDVNNIDGNIWIQYSDKECNAKSLLGLLSLGLKSGTDYNMKITDTNSSLYYKNAVTKIPDFYDVFTIYFNRYYNIYYNKLNAGSLGTLSLTSVIEEIQSVHDNVYGSLFNANTPATNAQFADSFYNKPQVEYEMGSMPTDTNGNATGFDDLVNANDFSLTIDKSKAKIGIAYKQKAVDSSYVSLATAAEAVFGLTDEELEFGDGSGFSSDFGMTDIEIEFKNATES